MDILASGGEGQELLLDTAEKGLRAVSPAPGTLGCRGPWQEVVRGASEHPDGPGQSGI